MDNCPRQPSEGSHSVPLQRLADLALRIERELSAIADDRTMNDFYKLKRTTECVIELARAIRALAEYYA
jgi:hypothetical protein